MPEAPEVENVVRYLERNLLGTSIRKARIFYPKLIDGEEAPAFEKALAGETFLGFERYGKYLVFHMKEFDWVSHLRMEGGYRIENGPGEITKHTHALFELEDGRVLLYRDTRKFGRMERFSRDLEVHPIFSRLGKDVLDETFRPEELYLLLQRRKKAIKSVLLDQKVIAGIGNIYANEILFACRIHPLTPANRITLEQCAHILAQTRSIISRAIELRGTTIRTFHIDHEEGGTFQDFLAVHMQKECPHCHQPIERLKIDQRSAYLCPNCQKQLP